MNIAQEDVFTSTDQADLTGPQTWIHDPGPAAGGEAEFAWPDPR
jgi:hypothetical protein